MKHASAQAARARIWLAIGLVLAGTMVSLFTPQLVGEGSPSRLEGPDVGVSGVPVLSSGGVNPASGYNGTTWFTFSVVVTDPGNATPAWVHVSINGTVHAMEKADPSDDNLVDGCTYVFGTTLASPGSYVLAFDASNGTHAATTLGPVAGPLVIPRAVYFRDDFQDGSSKWPVATGFWDVANASSPITEDFEGYPVGAFTSTGGWNLPTSPCGAAIVQDESKVLRLGVPAASTSYSAYYTFPSPAPVDLSGESVQFDWTPNLFPTSLAQGVFVARDQMNGERIFLRYDPGQPSQRYTFSYSPSLGSYTLITTWYDARTNESVGSDVLLLNQKHAIKVEFVSLSRSRFWVYRYDENRWFKSDVFNNANPFGSTRWLAGFRVMVEGASAGGNMKYDNIHASWTGRAAANRAAWFGRASTGTFDWGDTPVIDDFSTFPGNTVLRNVSTGIGTWNAWAGGAGFNFSTVTRAGKSWARWVDASSASFAVRQSFQEARTWMAGDWFEFTYERVSGLNEATRPAFLLGRTGVGPLIEIVTSLSSFSSLEGVFSGNGAGSTTMVVLNMALGAHITVRLTHASDTQHRITVWEDGVVRANATYTNIQTRSWSANPIDYLDISSGASQTNEVYITNLTASWIRVSRARGVLVSSAFSLPAGKALELEFSHMRAGDGTRDVSSVLVSTDGGTSWVEVYNDTRGIVPAWERVRVDLTPFGGNASVKLALSFDSIDPLGNQFLGWLVDDIVVADARAPLLSNGTVVAVPGPLVNTFDFTATYRHPMNLPPAFINAFINGTRYPMLSGVKPVPLVEDFETLHLGDVRNQASPLGVWFREGSTFSVSATVVDVGGDKQLQVRDTSGSEWINVHLSFREKASAERGDAIVGWTQRKLDWETTAVAIREYTNATCHVQLSFTIEGAQKVRYMNRAGSLADTGLTWERNVDEHWEIWIVDRDTMMIRKNGGAWHGPFQTWRQFSTGAAIDNVQILGVQVTNPNYDIKNVSCSWLTVPASDFPAGRPYTFRLPLQPGTYETFFETSDGMFHAVLVCPPLTVTNEHDPVLSSGTVAPGFGFGNVTSFTFSVIYSDADNNTPAWVNVTINGTSHAMAKQDPLDDNYVDGCTYVFSTMLSASGMHEYLFEASDGTRQAMVLGPFQGPLSGTFNDAVDNHDLLFTHGGDAPWYGQASESWDGLHAARSGFITGNQETWFQASVAGPGIVRFRWRVSSEASSDFFTFHVNGTVMATGSGAGAWAQHAGTIIDGGVHELRWRYAKDAAGSAGSDCAWVDRIEWIPIHAPVLIDGEATPSPGAQDAPVTFTVTYVDADNDAPTYVRAVVNGTLYSMQKVNVSDVNFTDGCEYRVVVYLEPGTYEYRFETSDGLFTNVTQTITGLVIAPVNDHAPVLSSGLVTPWAGTNTTTNYTFTVVYTDLDNNAPAWVNVTINGTSHAMSKQDPLDVVYVDGCTYVFSILLVLTVDLEYAFDASDGSRDAGTLGPFAGPVFITFNDAVDNHDLVFTHGGVSSWFVQTQETQDGLHAVRSGPITHNEMTWFETTVTGPGRIVFYYRVSSQITYDRIRFQVNGSSVLDRSGLVDWTRYSRAITGNGVHTIRWLYMKDASVSMGSDCAWVDRIQWLPLDPPSLVNSSVTPAGGPQDQAFNFTVTYVDPGNVFPTYVRVAVNGTLHTMQRVNASDVDFTDGSEYTVLVLLQPGTYTYQFQTAIPGFTNATQVFTGLLVTAKNDHDPVLSSPSLAPLVSFTFPMTFTFSVVYTDADNNPPAWVTVTVNGTSHAMTKQVPSDTNFMDGCVYVASISLATPGTYEYVFDASDGTRGAGTLGPFQGPSLFTFNDAVDNHELAFTHGGNAVWFAQGDVTWDGLHAARSGTIANSQQTWFQTYVQDTGMIRFYWRVSSEPGKDTLQFRLNGTLVQQISGSVGWQLVEFFIDSRGNHTLRWTYAKDASGIVGPDCGWIDQIAWIPHEPAPPGLASGGVDPLTGTTDTTFNFTVSLSGGQVAPVDYVRVMINGTPYLMERAWITDDMSSLPLGNPNGMVGPLGTWTATAGSGCMANVVEVDGTKQLLLVDTAGSTNWNAWIDLDRGISTNGVDVVRFRHSITTERFNILLQQGSTIGVQIYFDSSNLVRYYNGASFINTGLTWASGFEEYEVMLHGRTHFYVRQLKAGTWSSWAGPFQNRNPYSMHGPVVNRVMYSGSTADRPKVTVASIAVSWADAGSLEAGYRAPVRLAPGTYEFRFETSNGVFENVTQTYTGLVVNDPPLLLGGVAINNSVISHEEIGRVIDWSIEDVFGGAGLYRVLINGSIHVDWTAWVSGVPLDVPVDMGRGLGTWTYTIQYRDVHLLDGEPGTVHITIADLPRVNQPPGMFVVQGAVASIDWVLVDTAGPGHYLVLVNGSVHVPWTAWSNNTSLDVPVLTNPGLGYFNYTILYNNTNGFFGAPGTVFVHVNDIPIIASGPANHTSVLQNGTATLTWILVDKLAPGNYTITRNGSVVAGHVLVSWTNNTPVHVDVDTNAGCGWVEYTITFWDARLVPGVPESILIWIEDVPVIVASSLDGMVLHDAAGVSVSWTVVDLAGSGNYTVSCNGTPVAGHVNATWTSGVPVVVPVATGTIGSFTYEIAFNDVVGVPGVNGTIIMVVNDVPLVSWMAGDGTFVVQNGTASVSWVLVDGLGAGTYTVTCNGLPVPGHEGQPWVNATVIDVAVDTGAGWGTMAYQITFTDAHGTAGTPSTITITVEDIPRVVQAPVVSMVMVSASPVNVSWELVDMTGGGTFTALVNGVPVLTAVPWSNGTPVVVPVPASVPGVVNVTVRYEDERGIAGPQSVLLLTVNDYPRVVEAQPAIRIQRGWSDIILTWTMEDTVGGGGICRLYRDGLLLSVDVSWTSGQPRMFLLNNTNLAPRQYTYVIRYWDAHGAEGVAASVVVTIYEDKSPLLAFIEEYLLLIVGAGAGLVVVVAVSAAVARRKGKVKASMKTGKPSPGKSLAGKPAPGSSMPGVAPAGAQAPSAPGPVPAPDPVPALPLPAPAPVPAQPVPVIQLPNLTCTTCRTEFTVEHADPNTPYTCPACTSPLAWLSRCPACHEKFALKQEDHVRYKNTAVSCTRCGHVFTV